MKKNEVASTCMNEGETCANSDTKRAQGRSVPVRYRLISPSGHGMGTFASALEAASAAGGFWPGIGQKEDDGPGWDLEVVR